MLSLPFSHNMEQEANTPQVSDRLRGGTEKSTPQGGIELNDKHSGVRH
jgi:hypothetical protein